jgi:hypothetical protein
MTDKTTTRQGVMDQAAQAKAEVARLSEQLSAEHRAQDALITMRAITPEDAEKARREAARTPHPRIARLKRRFHRAQNALAEAQRLAKRAYVAGGSTARYRELLKLVEQRRAELRQIEMLMMPSSYSGRDHRGRGSARHETGHR